MITELDPQIKPINPLHQAILVSEILDRFTRERFGSSEAFPWMPWIDHFDRGFLDWLDADAPIPSGLALPRETPLKKLELLGTREAHAVLTRRGGEIMFCNDLSLDHRGFDFIARTPERSFVFCEAKATRRPIQRSPGRYLARTKTKGRQLSAKWIWRSMVEMTEQPSTARCFLNVLRPLLSGEVDRILCVARFDEADTLVETRLWTEDHLRDYPPLGAMRFEKPLGWLNEIEEQAPEWLSLLRND